MQCNLTVYKKQVDESIDERFEAEPKPAKQRKGNSIDFGFGVKETVLGGQGKEAPRSQAVGVEKTFHFS